MKARYIVFAGINGAGKSTLYRSGLWTHSKRDMQLPRINPDEIVAEHNWNPADTKAQIRSGEEALSRISTYFETCESFNQETTLTGKLIMRNIEKARNLNYQIIMHYVGLENPAIALDRIAYRVSRGGHPIPREKVLHRAAASEKNLQEAIRLCNEVYLYDNTETLALVAALREGSVVFCTEHPRVAWVSRVVQAFQ